MQKNTNRLCLLTYLVSVVILILLIATFKNYNDEKYSKTIVFLGNKNIPPIVYEEDEMAKGVAVDIVKALGKEIACNVKIQATDWSKAQDMVLEGDADALIQINPSPEREILFDFSDTLLESQFSIFADSGSLYIRNINDLRGKTVGVEEGGYAYNLLQKYIEIKLITFPDLYTGFEMIKSGELDALVSDRWIGEYQLARSNVAGIQVVGQPIEIQYSRIAVRKGNEEILDLINLGLRQIKESGQINEILSKWSGQKIIYFTRDKVINIILTVALVIVLAILIISGFLIDKYKRLSNNLESDVKLRTRELHQANELLKKANQELKKITMIDGLTSIYNRRYFDKAIEEAWQQALEHRQKLALLMIDIDEFKKFNDTHGHLAGDEVLRSIAAEIKDLLKKSSNFVARYGGEELAVLLVNTSKVRATIMAEEIRTKIEKLKVHCGGMDLKVTVSIGGAVVIPDDDITIDDFIHAADEAMYEAKDIGRNKVVMYDEDAKPRPFSLQ
ncbi:MAG: diguanylate cyclase [Clostridiales bacterium]|nr:diguanylate cyclase [Clostridiales bacterium]